MKVDLINKEQHAIEMLTKMTYLTANSKGSEDVWLIAYLIQNKYEKTHIQEIWQAIYESRYGKVLEQYNTNKIFEQFYKKASAMSLTKGRTAVVYKEELDLINKCLEPLWFKQYLLVLLVYCKLRQKTEYNSLPYTAIVRYITALAKPQNYSLIYISSKLKEYKLIKIVENKVFNSFDGELDIYERVKIIYLQEKGEEVFSVNQLKDIVSYFYLIKMERVCPQCGKAFVYNGNTKRDICYDCWKEQDKEKRRIREFERRQKIKMEKAGH